MDAVVGVAPIEVLERHAPGPQEFRQALRNRGRQVQSSGWKGQSRDTSNIDQADLVISLPIHVLAQPFHEQRMCVRVGRTLQDAPHQVEEYAALEDDAGIEEALRAPMRQLGRLQFRDRQKLVLHVDAMVLRGGAVVPLAGGDDARRR